METVRLLDDNRESLFAIRSILEYKNYHVLESRDPAEAVRVCREHNGPIHLIIADVILRGSYGDQAAERLRDISPATPVLFISGLPLHELQQRGILMNFGVRCHFMQKPFKTNEFSALVRHILDHPERAVEAVT